MLRVSILSNWFFLISKNHNTDVAGAYFKTFDDSVEDPPRINSKTWFHRVVESRAGCCRKKYDIEGDRQRFCRKCSKWMHFKCMRLEEGDEGEQDWVERGEGWEEPNMSDVAQQMEICRSIGEGPVVRGHDNQFDWENNWLTTGSGRQVSVARFWAFDGTVPDGWLTELGENFVKEFLGKRWKKGKCPRCEAWI